MTAAQARQRARELVHQERNTGPAWKQVIDTLGYDPRQGQGKGTSLKWQSGNGGAQAPKAEPKPEPTPKPPMPGRINDSQYTTDVAHNQFDYQSQLGDISLQQDRTGFDTGFGAGGQLDLRNPYSQAMMLQRYWEQNQQGTSASYAARGQLYSGARQRALDESTQTYQRNRSGLATQSQRTYEDLTRARQQATSSYFIRNQQAGAAQAQRWADAERRWYELYG